MIGSNVIVKNAKKFSEQRNEKKFGLKIPYSYREIIKRPKLFHSVMTTNVCSKSKSI